MVIKLQWINNNNNNNNNNLFYIFKIEIILILEVITQLYNILGNDKFVNIWIIQSNYIFFTNQLNILGIYDKIVIYRNRIIIK